ncbi:SDR family NAD(P)-dependent oxidoreductase [Microbispora cellulosiformans]|uniref:SDR family NAD(P)-dependent oxidoreductase n=1 Tax=Microbispora cellulosiformans TaxID=2614688 RepID=A0A5J5K0U1_9ACTN|nr:type I polyketide synthase [Microbispora cellulosiformans]KAA9377607.1 SDR family NAD(P)-dependent oxidoreductase [Microbispora cellulosiformans]
MTRIAIVGMACRYPDATSPDELWDNAVAGRRAFRRLPDVRMRLEDYWDPDPAAPDRFYARNAAVIEGYAFDRVAHKIAGSTYRSTDLTHWLALDVAGAALADAGFPAAEGLARERTGVVVGNTLTGEFVRANQMRLRWPYVRRLLAAALKEQSWDDDRLAGFLGEFEAAYKRPFPPVDEDTLAGGLSNTIAGRVCNHFDLKGGGYTVDGACSSSLLSVVTAARSLLEGEIDIAVAGGVDLSIDPFEIIGFAKTGALAREEMRVYDRRSNGFWPGEGCGMVVLMRERDALEAGHRVYATIAGWGVSSDGRGGITRPELDGYRLALRRAYERAGFGVETAALFEGHGTGTAVGDATELKALSTARTDADPAAPPAAIGSVKGMIGHTKAAAGVAGLIKAAMAVHHRVLPPAVGCLEPHELLTEEGAALRALRAAEPWPEDAHLRAGVTAMGFGGINTHLVLDGDGVPEENGPRRRSGFDSLTRAVAASIQDAELLLVDGSSAEELGDRLTRLIDFVPGLSYAQLADLAAVLQGELRDLPYRAAVVVSSPEDAERRLRRVREALYAGQTSLYASDGRTFLGRVDGPARVGYLFPGQGSGTGTGGGALRRRFAEVDELYGRAALPATGDTVATAVAQPRIVTGSAAGLRALSVLGVDAVAAVGHSLGEITALHWAGAMDEETLLRVARARGGAMAEHSAEGTMAGVAAPGDVVEGLAGGIPVVIAGYNGPGQTVVAGSVEAVEAFGRAAERAGVTCTRLPVSHAFHSPLVAPAADAFAEWLAGAEFGPVTRTVVSTVTGEALPRDTEVAPLLRRQITSPVRFAQALASVRDVDLLVEVGPGRVLSGLASAITDVPAVALDTDDESLGTLLGVAGAAYVTGAPVVHGALFEGRLVRPLEIGAEFTFFASPCEQAPTVGVPESPRPSSADASGEDATGGDGEPADPSESSAGLLRSLAAERAELPPDAVGDDSRLLDDLHLSSITVGQIVNQAAKRLGMPPVAMPTNFATATVRELAEALDELAGTGQESDARPAPIVAGAAPWIRPFAVDFDPAEPPARPAREADGPWTVHAPEGHPFAASLGRALEGAGAGAGALVCLPPDCAEEHLEAALEGARAALAGPSGGRFVLVQQGRRGATGLAKTLRLEAPHLRVTVVRLPDDHETGHHAADGVPVDGTLTDRIVTEVAATTDFTEVCYDAGGTRRVPTLRAMPVRSEAVRHPIGDGDVLLVTGGGKGITAECALALATGSGARLALIGRSDPEQDHELAANLSRMTEAGVTVWYGRADVTDPGEVRAAVAEAERALGPVTAVLHGAGRNEPAALTGLDMTAFRDALAPKVDGLKAVLDVVDAGRLRLLVTFGSIIGRAGLRGEAHYSTANEWLAALTEDLAERHPGCRALCLEWSVWSGVGMGERLSVVESLSRDGITPIPPTQGVEILRRLVADPAAPPVVVISGRTEGIRTVRYDLPPLPLLRFVDRPLVRYHGVELVTETELSSGTDPYLDDHLLDGNMLFPAVFGMEAMAQNAAAATGRTTTPVIEDAEFLRPVVVPPGGSTKIRIAVAATGDDVVEAVIRSEETGFAADHFRARLLFTGEPVPDGPPYPVGDDVPEVRLDPAGDLYGGLLFQGRRFQRLLGYHRAAAHDVDADVAAVAAQDWFAGFLSGDLLLGDPGLRDALMHGLQVCVPHATLLPAGVDRIHPLGEVPTGGRLRLRAAERYRDGDLYVYDVAVRTDAGEVVERWEGLRLRAVRKGDGRGPWPAPLLGPYLERTAEELLGVAAAVAVEPDPPREQANANGNGNGTANGNGNGSANGSASANGDGTGRGAFTELAAGRVLGRRAEVRHRPDGRPELGGETGGPAISASHGADVTLCVAGDGPAATVACDVEPVAERPAEEWQALLGPYGRLAGLVADETGEGRDAAATRVWAAAECLRKAGLPADAPLTLAPPEAPDWTVLVSGGLRIGTLVTTLRGEPGPVVFAVLAEGRR